MKTNRNAYLKDENLLTLFSLNNLIIPEIQREYVWGNNYDVLAKFLEDLEKKSAPCPNCHHVHTDKNVNVGFLYSYKPQYVRYESSRIMDEYLIDGQQRVTTLFLLLLYRATLENRLDDFLSIFRIEEYSFEMGFNYKVRSLTQRFVIQLIEHAKTKGVQAFDFINDIQNDKPYWLLDDYLNDPTVTSMLKALKCMSEKFGNKQNYYFDYLLTNIHFWHFKTEATSQGEELYITMNSRGEQLTDNEMKKARTLPSDKLVEYGSKWEDWQTVFWRHRGNNYNSDKGFNNYLSAIEGLEWFLKTTERRITPKFESIEVYINALKYITSEPFKESLNKIYNGLYTKWFDSYINELWSIINDYDGEWDIIDPRGGGNDAQQDYKNKSIARNKSMLFWPWMYYFTLLQGSHPDDSYLIRLLHFYYIRYNCYKRSTTTIKAIVDITMQSGFRLSSSQNIEDADEEDNTDSKTFSEEEILLSGYYYNEGFVQENIESIVWEIQDLSYFLDGKYIGGNTILDYIRKDVGIIDEQDLENSLYKFRDAIKFILPNDDENGNISVKRALLLYKIDEKAFWIQQTPWYYTNYETSSWRRIVRTPHFIQMYKDFIVFKFGNNNATFEEFLNNRRTKVIDEEIPKTIYRDSTKLSHRKLCILYDAIKEWGIWDNRHKNIVFKKDIESDEEILSGQDTMWQGTRYCDPNERIALPQDWRDILLKKYGISVQEKEEILETSETGVN